MAADPHLVEAWLRARSVCRDLPQPVRERGGLRLDTGLPGERRRYVFAQVTRDLVDLGAAIVDPDIHLKLCDTGARLAALLPDRWRLAPALALMACDVRRGPAPPQLAPGYRLHVKADDGRATVRVLCGGDPAASGHAAERDGVFVYDRIVTADGHCRRGLGRAVMAALLATRRSPASRQVLVATAAGRALYATLGWSVLSPYASAVIPGPDTPVAGCPNGGRRHGSRRSPA